MESASVATRFPFDMNINMSDIHVDGHELTSNEVKPFVVDVTFVGADYFLTMGIPLLEGRPFRESDTEGSPGVVIVNEKLARTLWPEEAPSENAFVETRRVPLSKSWGWHRTTRSGPSARIRGLISTSPVLRTTTGTGVSSSAAGATLALPLRPCGGSCFR